MNNALVKLAKLADKLDQLGMFDHADQLDIVLAEGQRTRAVDDFINELNRIFAIVANDPRVESINKDNLQVILNVINTVAEKGTFLGPSIKNETFEVIKDEVNTTIESMIELGHAIVELNEAHKREQDPNKKQELKMDLDNDRKKFAEIWAIVDTWRNGRRAGDAEKYKKWEKLWNERRHEIGF